MFMRNENMKTNENDEIEVNGIKYVRKQEEPKIYDAVRSPNTSQYFFRCGAPDCYHYASDYSYVRNSVLVVTNNGYYDELFFTCSEGHRNKLRI